MSFTPKTWVNGDYTRSTDFNRMEYGISTAIELIAAHTTSTSSVHGVVNLAGSSDTQVLTGKSASSSTDYDSRLLRNAVYSTSTSATTAVGDLLLLYS